MASNPYYANFIPAASQQPAGTQAYGASAGQTGYAAGGHSATGQTYDTAYPNTAAFAGYYGLAAKPSYEPAKQYFQAPSASGKHEGAGLPPAHYQGYEAALFNAAQAYLQQQSGSKAAHIPGAPVPGKGGKKNRYFNQRWASSSSQQLHYCEVCKISCASPQTYKDHLEGQKHKKKEAAIRTGMPLVPTPRTGAALHCELCNVTCTSSDAYAAHIRGTKHQKVVKLHTKLGKPIPPAEPQLIHSVKTGASSSPAATPAQTPTAAAPAAPTAPLPSTATTPSSTTTSTSPVGPTVNANNVPKAVTGSPKINFLGGNYLNSMNGSKQAGAGDNVVVASSPTEKEIDTPITAAVATETALSVVAQWEEEKIIQPVGQDYVEELRGPDGKINGFNCRLCDCRFNDVNAKDMHLKGRRHRLMYKKKVDPNLIVESKGWPAQRRQVQKAWAKRDKPGEPIYWEGGEAFEELMKPPGPGGAEEAAQSRAAFWAGSGRGMRHGGPMGLPPPPQYFPGGPMNLGIPNPAMRKPESNDDRHVIAKHSEIYPSDEELEAIQTQVSYVERALKFVSDELTSVTEESSTETATATPQRMLKGVMRVGLLAKGLLLKGDRIVQLVVLCSQAPTFELLDNVAKALPAHLAVVAAAITFNVEPRPDEALVEVKSVQGHGLSGEIVVKVSLTSPVVREEQLAAAANGGTHDVDMKEVTSTKEGRLNTKDCLHALALLRRAKWFQARANSLQHCVLVIRVMRDFCMRSPVWANLEFWAMELIVERAAYSAGSPLSPGDAFRRVLETLSAGILLTSGDGWSPGIGDPCEKDAVDACGNLTPQEREDITAAAQLALRQVAFRQIYKVLGMSKPIPMGPRFKPGPSPGKKRPRENSQSEAVSPEEEVPGDLKKEKIEGVES